MSKQELRNANGNLRGTIDEQSDGVRVLRDANGRLVGKGDQLSSLL